MIFVVDFSIEVLLPKNALLKYAGKLNFSWIENRFGDCGLTTNFF